MYKFFVVGLGGSGGKTLQFLMDSLRSELQGRWLEERLPACWKFVHVDLPAEGDGVGEEYPPVVKKQGGTYIPVTSGPHDKYQDLDAAVEQKLATNPNSTNLRELVGWRPDAAEAHSTSIWLGAGQYRAIGRLTTLARSGQIYAGLAAAADELTREQADADQRQLAALFGDGSDERLNSTPFVIVVSSLAGGTGASMTLDICNLLRAIPNFPGSETVALLYTPEVFRELQTFERGGVDANALATAAELLSALGHQFTEWTDAEWAVYGAAAGKPQSPGRGPRTVIPIGGKSNGVTFGNGRSAVIYRGLARALAGMVLSNSQTTEFRAYSSGANMAQAIISMGDSLGLTVNPTTGQPVGIFGFPAIGFATIGLGRDRYAEYAAQRLAKASVERLLFGYRDDRIASGDITEERALQERIGQAYELFTRWVGIPPVANDSRGIKTVVDDLWEPSERDGMAAELAESIVGSARSGEGTGAHFADLIQNGLNRHWEGLVTATDQRLAAAAERWVPSLQSRVEVATLRVAGESGLAVATGVLNRFAADLLVNGQQLAAYGSGGWPPSVITEELGTLRAIGQRIKGSYHGVVKVASTVSDFLLDRGQRSGAELAAQLLIEMVGNLIRPLTDSLFDCEKQLRQAYTDQSERVVAASVRTELVSQWPSDGPVPNRFRTATNEVLLEDHTGYGATFDTHVREDTGERTRPLDQALSIAVAQLISLIDSPERLNPEVSAVRGFEDFGGRTFGSGNPAAQFRLGRRREWWPPQLPSRTQSIAAYTPRLNPADLLASSRQWVQRPTTSFGRHTAEGLRTHLTDGAPSARERQLRQDNFVNKFERAMQLARPLADFDPGQRAALHNELAATDIFQLTEIPLAGTELESRLRTLILNHPNIDAQKVGAMLASVFTNDTRSRIDIIANSAPVSPLALSSLQTPIRDRWHAVQSDSEGPKAFWRWRRSRPLTEFVPVLPGWLDAMVFGWLVARLTGDLTIPRDVSAAGLPAERAVSVYDEGAQRQYKFPNPLLGLERSDLADAWTLLAAVMESMPLAMAQSSGDPKFTALLPYRTLRNFYTHNFDAGARIPSLERWLDHGVGSAGSASAIVDLIGVDRADRTASAKMWLDDVVAQYSKHAREVVTIHNFNRVSCIPAWELATVIVKAAQAVGAQIETDGGIPIPRG
ncbi:MAG: tubulin-like doman-containing protein [Actinomycetota bacterium]|nr:tubulin-like doman-containing protein [Actinomycetota bacterium]MDQ2956244.1 tubulin-like doman-containing protein [Actinomycetota bacterium]